MSHPSYSPGEARLMRITLWVFVASFIGFVFFVAMTAIYGGDWWIAVGLQTAVILFCVWTSFSLIPRHAEIRVLVEKSKLNYQHCMVCDAYRPGRCFSTQPRPTRGLEAHFPTFATNVRFCTDSESCRSVAFGEGAWLGRAGAGYD
jgi:hypothetical protein